VSGAEAKDNYLRSAVIGLLIGAFGIFAVLIFVVYQNNAAVRAGNEAATIQNLKTIVAVQVQYFNNHKQSFGTFEQLVNEGLLSSKFARDPVDVDGYVIKMTVTPPTPTHESSFKVWADPREAWSGSKHFYFDSSFDQIHVNPDQPAGANDSLLSDS
jgi:hypothetical protein